MKKSGILNKSLLTAIADMGHTDIMIIADAGLPIPDHVQRIDIALTQDVPTIAQVLELVMNDMIYERVVVAEEQKQYNKEHYRRICELTKACNVETVPHEQIMDEIRKVAKYIVRTGSFEPWGNVVLFSGIDANKWFAKDGVVTPDFYAERSSIKY